jgi:L-threonylcarbamoyladenylate synthase
VSSPAEIDAAVTGLRAGKPVVLPTDTVYGLCANAYVEAPVRRALALKGRGSEQPAALLAADVGMLFECVPELRGRAGVIVRALLPGPYTLVLPNPGRRFRWLTGVRPDTIGVRVADVPPPARSVLDRVGAVMATSANLTGGPDPVRLEDVPDEIRRACAAALDAGELPGLPSTVIDFTGDEPAVLREGAAPSAEAIQRALSAVS